MKTLLLIILILSLSYSNENTNTDKNLFQLKQKEEKKNDLSNEDLINSSLNTIEDGLDIVYNKLNSSSKYIDEFLTNEKDDLKYTKSYIRIENSIEKDESKNLDSEIDIDIRLILPKLKNKLSITIDNHDDYRTDNQRYEDSTKNLNNEDHKYNIGLLYNTIKRDLDLKLRAGLKLTSNPYFYTEGKLSKLFIINEQNSINASEKLRYSHKRKLDNYTSIEYTFKINEKYSFHNYNEYHINSEEKNDDIFNSIRLFDKISDKKYLNYVASISSDDRNSNFKVKEYETYVSYRSFIRKWLYYDLVPRILWQEENDFDRDLGFRINLGILIGK